MNMGLLRAWRAVVLLGSVVVTHWAHAIDIEEGNPPQQIEDLQMTIGARTLKLPAGSWTFVAKRQDHTSDQYGMNKETRPKTFTAYAMSVHAKSMQAGVVLKLPLSSHHVSRWVDEPCQVKDPLFKDDFQSPYGQSDCLLIFKRKSHLTSSNDAFYSQAKEWLRAQSIANPGPVYEVQYFRFSANEYGWVRVFIPQNLATSEAAVVDFARQLPVQLKAFFEKRVVEAALPPLPLRADGL